MFGELEIFQSLIYLMNPTASGQQDNPIYINSSDYESDDESDDTEEDQQEDDFNFLFQTDNIPKIAFKNDNFPENHAHNIPQALNAPMLDNPFAQAPLPPPIFPPPIPGMEQMRNNQQEDQFLNRRADIRNILGHFFPPPPQNVNDMLFRNHRILRHPANLFQAVHTPEPPQPPPNNIKRKKIQLYGIEFTIIDVPQKVLATLKKGHSVSPNFDLAKASTYVQMVLQHGDIPNDFLDRLVIAACDPKTASSYNFNHDSDLVLRNLLPDYRIVDIKKGFKQNKQMILDTINFFKQNQTISKISKRRITVTELTVDDPVVSVQLDEIFLDYEKERKKKEKEEEEENQIKQAELNGSLYECECCICEYPLDWMLQCPEGHLICKKCVEKQIEVAISEGRSNVPCLKFGGCDQTIHMEELQRLIPEKTIERLVATETLNAITVAEIKGKVKCHKCGFIVIYDGNGPMNCPQCKSQTCPKCEGAWHPNMTCEQFKEIDKDRLVEEQMNEAVVRTCPNCKTQFMKDEGCNKMECPRCHTWICYWCRAVIPKEVGYEHFWRQTGPCPPDKCPLWVQNDTLHLIEAEKAKDHAKDDLQQIKPNEINDDEN